MTVWPMWGETTPTEARAIAAAKGDHSAYTLSGETLVKAQHLTRLGEAMFFAGAVWGIVLLWLILRLRLAARMEAVAERLTQKKWLQGLVFMAQLLLATTLLTLPLRIFGHHEAVLFGFSVLGWGGWVADQAKAFAVNLGIYWLIAMVLYWLMRRFPQRWWLALWFPVMGMVLFGVYLSPLVIDPLYHRFEPLELHHPELVEQLERVAHQGSGIDIAPERMFLMRASEKTTLMNAYVTGFGGSKRLVLYDTLIRKASPDIILSTAGHEMGHYVLGHVLRGILLSFVGVLAAFFVGFRVFRLLLGRYGQDWGVSGQERWAAMAIMLLVLQTMAFFAEPIDNAFSRGMEHDADVFGQEAIHGIVPDPKATVQAEFQLYGENGLTDPKPSPLMELWTDSHPSDSFRAAFAKHYDPWAEGEEPKYFRR